MIRIFTIVCICLISLIACKEKQGSDFVVLDLMSEGLPIELMAPEGAEIEKSDLGVMKDYTIKSGDDYFIQILSSQASNFDAKALTKDFLEEVKRHPFFSKIIQEDETGFIFEKQIDENNINYDFRYIKIQGNDEYIFQTGLIGTFTEDQVRAMYQAVQ
jgi:hypothetical protein